MSPIAPPTDRRTLLRAGAGTALTAALGTACGSPPPSTAVRSGAAASAGQSDGTGTTTPTAPATPTGPDGMTGTGGTPTTRTTPAPTATHPGGKDSGAGASGRSAPAPAPHRFPGRPAQIEHGPRDRPAVALTFHGQGDPAIATTLLTEAERAGARVTVLAVGSWLDEHPAMARRILDGGHDLGNHTQRHLTISDMPDAEALREITACAQRLRRLTGSIGTWFRPSRTQHVTPRLQRLAHRAGYPHVLSYDVDSLDFTSPGATAVTRKVAGEIRNGSVVSLHFGYADTVAALPALLDDLHRRGLRAVTTTELLTP
ncbi:polysaccharide deacetylase family protein [Streptomyces sp. NBC_00237]|uniref:polysaccharide deacetylase family protein n=1 Tax=Streptomyces sp. NBC_00237 TaxID=2975687 RepID=UPI00225A137A|nr:polysaccharide deacetylase family protein [Streptomyces sp. NBC_00237]MCX5204082.1 polysaccharide deacetylase family protein [Streptomyces sp. NBC_00237]